MKRACLRGVYGYGQGPFWVGLCEALRSAGFHATQAGSSGYPIRDGNEGSVAVRLHVRGCMLVQVDAAYELPPKQYRKQPEMARAHSVVLRYTEVVRSQAQLEQSMPAEEVDVEEDDL